MIRITRGFLIALIVGWMALQFIGCGEDTGTVGDDQAPELPPAESMTVDLSLFEQQVAAGPALTAQFTRRNFAAAVARAAIINTAVVAGLTPPAALFSAARSTEPVRESDQVWVWTYTKSVEQISYTAKLTATVNREQTVWSMVVSNTANLRDVTDFEWYRGTTSRSNRSGTWQFYDIRTPEVQNPTIKINWSIDESTKETLNTFEVVESQSQYTGYVLEYHVVQGTAASLSFKDAAGNEAAEIFWELPSGAGSLVAPEYNNGEKACWDANQEDVPCS